MIRRTYVVTFGFGQILSGCYTKIVAASKEKARQRVRDEYGRMWAMLYDSEEEAGCAEYNLKFVPFGTPNGRR